MPCELFFLPPGIDLHLIVANYGTGKHPRDQSNVG